MRTVLCSTTAGRGAFLLALVAGVVGGPLAGSAAASSGPASDAPRAGHHRPQGATAGGKGSAVLGPAVKYVRSPDGSVRRVR